MKQRISLCVAVAASVLYSGVAFAQSPEGVTARAEKTAEADKRAIDEFAGLKFGVGLSLTLDAGENDRVSEAQLVNNIVRVNNQDNARARIMLESHYFFLPSNGFLGVKPLRWGWGPFVAIQPGEANIVDAIGGGLMLGFRRETGTESFNIGVGAVVDPNTRILGDGIIANQPLPAGETEIRYKEKEQWGWVILTSFSF